MMINALKILTIFFAVVAIVLASGCASNNTKNPTPTETPVSTSAETFKQNETSANLSGQNVTVTDENASADEGDITSNDTDVPNDYGNDTAVQYVNNTTVDIPGSGDQGILNDNTTGNNK
jgi:hypothetical protein